MKLREGRPSGGSWLLPDDGQSGQDWRTIVRRQGGRGRWQLDEQKGARNTEGTIVEFEYVLRRRFGLALFSHLAPQNYSHWSVPQYAAQNRRFL